MHTYYYEDLIDPAKAEISSLEEFNLPSNWVWYYRYPPIYKVNLIDGQTINPAAFIVKEKIVTEYETELINPVTGKEWLYCGRLTEDDLSMPEQFHVGTTDGEVMKLKEGGDFERLFNPYVKDKTVSIVSQYARPYGSIPRYYQDYTQVFHRW